MSRAKVSRRGTPAGRFGAAPELVVILCGVGAALHIGKLPPALPVLRDEMGITLVEAGFLLSLMQFAGLALGVFVGLAADGLGLRRAMLGGLVLLAVASAAGGFAHGAAALQWWRAVEGFGFLLVALPAPSLIRRLVSPGNLSLRLGWWGCYMPVGAAIGLLLGPWVMLLFGWRSWWWSLAALSLLLAIWLMRTVPRDMPGSSAEPAALRRHDWWRRLRLTLTSGGPWLVAIGFAVYSAQWLAVIGFLPSIYMQAGIAGPLAGALTALAALSSVAGNLGSGALLHRGVPARRLLNAGFLAMALGAFLLFGPALAGMPAARYLAVLLFSSAGGLVPSTFFSLAVRVAPDEHTVSTTVGWIQQWASLGQFAGPPLVAWVAVQAGGWQWTWLVTGALSLVGLLTAWRLGALPPRTSA